MDETETKFTVVETSQKLLQCLKILVCIMTCVWNHCFQFHNIRKDSIFLVGPTPGLSSTGYWGAEVTYCFQERPTDHPPGTDFRVSSALGSLHTISFCWKIIYHQPIRKGDLKAALNYHTNLESCAKFSTFWPCVGISLFPLRGFITLLCRETLYLIYPCIPLKPKTSVCM